jgi:sugar phosphate isomerase/epimerase
MPKREWMLSTKPHSYADAKRDAAELGYELLTVPYFRLSEGSVIEDFKSKFPMVDWDELRAFLDDADVVVSTMWFAQLLPRTEDAPTSNKPNTRVLLTFAGEIQLKGWPSSTTMPYLASKIID